MYSDGCPASRHRPPHLEFLHGLFQGHFHDHLLRMLEIELAARQRQQRAIDVPGHEPNLRQRRQVRLGLDRGRLRRHRPVQVARVKELGVLFQRKGHNRRNRLGNYRKTTASTPVRLRRQKSRGIIIPAIIPHLPALEQVSSKYSPHGEVVIFSSEHAAQASEFPATLACSLRCVLRKLIMSILARRCR